MAISDKIPLMKPGHTIRNLLVGVAYFFVIAAVLGVGGDDDTDADIEADEGAAEAEAAEEEPEADEAEEQEGADEDVEESVGDDPPEEDERHDVTVTVADQDGNAISGANVEFVHDDAIIFNTRENKQTGSDGVVTFTTDHDSDVQISAEASGYEDNDMDLTVTEEEEVSITLTEVEEADEPEEAGVEEPETDESDTQEADEADEEDELDSVDEDQAVDTDGGTEVEQEASGEITPEVFEAFLIAEGYNVVEVTQRGGDLEVHYTSNAQTEQMLLEEMGFIAGAYAPMVDSGNDSDRLVGYIYDANGNVVGEWHANADSAQQFYDGEINEYEYSAEVLSTLESYD